MYKSNKISFMATISYMECVIYKSLSLFYLQILAVNKLEPIILPAWDPLGSLAQ